MKLTGNLNGAAVFFDYRPEEGIFSAEIPKSAAGTYVMELHLSDDAGNMSSECGIIVCIDFDELTARVLDLGFCTAQNPEEFARMNISDEFEGVQSAYDYSCQELMPEYTVEELMINVH